MADPNLVNIGTAENPKWVDEKLVWSRSFQSPEDHRAEGIASGSVLPDEGELEKLAKQGAPNEQKPQ